MASWRLRFHDKWPHLASLYASTHQLDEEGKHPDPIMGQDNVFDPHEPYGAYKYYIQPSVRSEFSIEEPPYQNRPVYKDEESRSSDYASGNSFRRGATCRVLLCVFLIFSFIAVVVAAITLAVLMSRTPTASSIRMAPLETFESIAKFHKYEYTEGLLDNSSKEFKDMEKTFCQSIREIFTNDDSPVKHEFSECQVLEFINGSIIARFRIRLQPKSMDGFKGEDKIDKQLEDYFETKIKERGTWQRVQFNPDFAKEFVKIETTTPAPATTTSQPTTPAPVITTTNKTSNVTATTAVAQNVTETVFTNITSTESVFENVTAVNVTYPVTNAISTKTVTVPSLPTKTEKTKPIVQTTEVTDTMASSITPEKTHVQSTKSFMIEKETGPVETSTSGEITTKPFVKSTSTVILQTTEVPSIEFTTSDTVKHFTTAPNIMSSQTPVADTTEAKPNVTTINVTVPTKTEKTKSISHTTEKTDTISSLITTEKTHVQSTEGYFIEDKTGPAETSTSGEITTKLFLKSSSTATLKTTEIPSTELFEFTTSDTATPFTTDAKVMSSDTPVAVTTEAKPNVTTIDEFTEQTSELDWQQLLATTEVLPEETTSKTLDTQTEVIVSEQDVTGSIENLTEAPMTDATTQEMFTTQSVGTDFMDKKTQKTDMTTQKFDTKMSNVTQAERTTVVGTKESTTTEKLDISSDKLIEPMVETTPVSFEKTTEITQDVESTIHALYPTTKADAQIPTERVKASTAANVEMTTTIIEGSTLNDITRIRDGTSDADTEISTTIISASKLEETFTAVPTEIAKDDMTKTTDVASVTDITEAPIELSTSPKFERRISTKHPEVKTDSILFEKKEVTESTPTDLINQSTDSPPKAVTEPVPELIRTSVPETTSKSIKSSITTTGETPVITTEIGIDYYSYYNDTFLLETTTLTEATFEETNESVSTDRQTTPTITAAPELTTNLPNEFETTPFAEIAAAKTESDTTSTVLSTAAPTQTESFLKSDKRQNITTQGQTKPISLSDLTTVSDMTDSVSDTTNFKYTTGSFSTLEIPTSLVHDTGDATSFSENITVKMKTGTFSLESSTLLSPSSEVISRKTPISPPSFPSEFTTEIIIESTESLNQTTTSTPSSKITDKLINLNAEGAINITSQKTTDTEEHQTTQLQTTAPTTSTKNEFVSELSDSFTTSIDRTQTTESPTKVETTVMTEVHTEAKSNLLEETTPKFESATSITRLVTTAGSSKTTQHETQFTSSSATSRIKDFSKSDFQTEDFTTQTSNLEVSPTDETSSKFKETPLNDLTSTEVPESTAIETNPTSEAFSQTSQIQILSTTVSSKKTSGTPVVDQTSIDIVGTTQQTHANQTVSTKGSSKERRGTTPELTTTEVFGGTDSFNDFEYSTEQDHLMTTVKTVTTAEMISTVVQEQTESAGRSTSTKKDRLVTSTETKMTTPQKIAHDLTTIGRTTGTPETVTKTEAFPTVTITNEQVSTVPSEPVASNVIESEGTSDGSKSITESNLISTVQPDVETVSKISEFAATTLHSEMTVRKSTSKQVEIISSKDVVTANEENVTSTAVTDLTTPQIVAVDLITVGKDIGTIEIGMETTRSISTEIVSTETVSQVPSETKTPFGFETKGTSDGGKQMTEAVQTPNGTTLVPETAEQITASIPSESVTSEDVDPMSLTKSEMTTPQDRAVNLTTAVEGTGEAETVTDTTQALPIETQPTSKVSSETEAPTVVGTSVERTRKTKTIQTSTFQPQTTGVSGTLDLIETTLLPETAEQITGGLPSESVTSEDVDPMSLTKSKMTTPQDRAFNLTTAVEGTREAETVTDTTQALPIETQSTSKVLSETEALTVVGTSVEATTKSKTIQTTTLQPETASVSGTFDSFETTLQPETQGQLTTSKQSGSVTLKAVNTTSGSDKVIDLTSRDIITTVVPQETTENLVVDITTFRIKDGTDIHKQDLTTPSFVDSTQTSKLHSNTQMQEEITKQVELNKNNTLSDLTTAAPMDVSSFLDYFYETTEAPLIVQTSVSPDSTRVKINRPTTTDTVSVSNITAFNETIMSEETGYNDTVVPENITELIPTETTMAPGSVNIQETTLAKMIQTTATKEETQTTSLNILESNVALTLSGTTQTPTSKTTDYEYYYETTDIPADFNLTSPENYTMENLTTQTPVFDATTNDYKNVTKAVHVSEDITPIKPESSHREGISKSSMLHNTIEHTNTTVTADMQNVKRVTLSASNVTTEAPFLDAITSVLYPDYPDYSTSAPDAVPDVVP